LPPDYDSTTKRYPVIYMHDGQNLFDDATSFAGEWHVDEHFNDLFSKGYPVPIIVGIDNGGAYRIDELTPYPNTTYGGGQGDKYVRFIVESLKPYIDSAFRTIPDRENTWIWGSSLGGLISFYAGVKYTDVFGHIGAFSPSFWINDTQIYNLIKQSTVKKPTYFYFLAGGQEGEDVAQDCHRAMGLLEQVGLDSIYMHLQVDPTGRHNEAFWSHWVEDAYLWLQFIGPEQADTAKSLDFQIYPNPVQDRLNIDSGYYFVPYLCQLLSLSGKVLIEQNCHGKAVINLSALPRGVYLLRMIGNGQVISNKVIKI
jgi:predicted alpha/beta superfamily hydrolase